MKPKKRTTINDAMKRIDGLENKIDNFVSKLTTIVEGTAVCLPEYVRAGDVYASQSQDRIILVFDSCIRTRYGLVHKWAHLKLWGKIEVGKVNDNAEGFIKDNGLTKIGELRDFINFNKLDDTNETL